MTVYEQIYVGKCDFVNLDDVQPNSMVVSSPATFYTFNPNRRGESTEGDKAADCYAEWNTARSLMGLCRWWAV